MSEPLLRRRAFSLASYWERLSQSNCRLRSRATEIGDELRFPEVLLPKSQSANGNKNPNFTPRVLRAINSYRRPGCMRETA